MLMSKLIYKCKVDGVLGGSGRSLGLCANSGVDGKCAAHGNYKCEHKCKGLKADDK